ncbi:hypothetical protein TVAG_235870 [Trichomonas vaginalis G3]|uniref:Heme-binding protein n=1 Tax=Trichomonas vaginalis (strain ATCC PRA-98 / G3) TaxID=412133 RepID=A2FBE1_TRIV3|nr:hem-degrading protein family [Trichomonas vaginalis G3]EAX97775.1 hypothetical protein TVAG_235870 [Trichomonas vaginalis G3]KAI5499030.1 hem-degrading protein family [Trichomonas vaginalis G3]|eukprot:XP_001310705.1 hypothetical protein [Trichomonas vaginalis G3]
MQNDFESSNILTFQAAQKIGSAAMEYANLKGYKVCITIVDRSCQILCVARHHQAGVHTVNASFKKAYTACSQKRTTEEIFNGIKQGTIPQELKDLDPNILVLPGGIPIIYKDEVIGGIGVGGAHLSLDSDVAKAGLIAVIDQNSNKSE